jgi:hypothetical protein
VPYKLETAERAALIRAKKLLYECQDLCKQASACGFDTSAQDMATQSLLDQIKRIEETFLPRKAIE